MDFTSATSDYEHWLGSFVPLQSDDLRHKHRLMANPQSMFPFFRGTYYRWAQHWPRVCAELIVAPTVLSVGDLHVENYGTWRDTDGRLVWGINDFDEADDLPYTQDLVRLAASVRLARRARVLTIPFRDACRVILKGYHHTLAARGGPFVLEERHPELRAMAMHKERSPIEFWGHLSRLLQTPGVDLPPDVKKLMIAEMPVKHLDAQYRLRPMVGVGSLGKPRYLGLAEWAGGWIAREAKAVTPPATDWAYSRDLGFRSRAADAIKKASRCPDPHFKPHGSWIIRRLAPRCSRIELQHLRNITDQTRLLTAMGAEAANIHVGTPASIPAILEDLDRRKKGWLRKAAREMVAVLEHDWHEWQKSTAEGGAGKRK
ncbi:DUF2252 family protein [Zavarzinella formosa]|uniref:DUF2252 family protein n=1 Tax=Zavarzinella formosa TaxID=360055 RepID=UPI0002FA7FF2|nr:DUF2252 family protein [Zavarzinella formosa]